MCSWKEGEGKEMLQEKCWRKGKAEDIYSLCLEGKKGIWCAACVEDMDLFECWQSWLELISEQQIDYSETGGHVSRKVILWRRSCRFERNQNMHSVKICRLSRDRRAEGIFWEDADLHVLVTGRWKPCRWIRAKKRVWFDQDSDDSVII